jgi:hypothetical protein
MKAIKLGATEIVLLVLITVTGAMALRDRLPASLAEIAQIGRLAATSTSAMREYKQAIESDSSMSIREARQLREKIGNMNVSRAPASRFEEARSDDDAWWQIHIRPFVPYALGALGAAIALQISHIRRKRHAAA